VASGFGKIRCSNKERARRLRSCRSIRRASAIAAALVIGAVARAASAEHYHLGTPIAPSAIAPWDIDVTPDGKGLPEGQGSVTQGRQVFTEACAMCHGDKGMGKPVPGASGGFDRLVGGFGTLDKAAPVKTVGSFWPYATTLFDYIRRAMPFNAPQTLSNDDVYAVCAYILYLNDIIPEDGVLDRASLPKVKMPNRDGFFTGEPLPGVKGRD
jgi:S-disulfanyl-L-cysteine oxidoreductase SoxD